MTSVRTSTPARVAQTPQSSTASTQGDPRFWRVFNAVGSLDPKTSKPYPTQPINPSQLTPTEQKVDSLLRAIYRDPALNPVFQEQRMEIGGASFSAMLGSYGSSIDFLALDAQGKVLGHSYQGPDSGQQIEWVPIPAGGQNLAKFQQVAASVGGLDPQTQRPFETQVLSPGQLSPAEKKIDSLLRRMYTDQSRNPVFQMERKKIGGTWYSAMLGSYGNSIDFYALGPDGTVLGHSRQAPDTNGQVEMMPY